MVFSSSLFFFGFMPCFFIGYFLCPLKLRNVFIICGSLFFYAWGAHSFILIALGTCVIDFILGAFISKEKNNPRTRLLLSAADVAVNIGLLAYFKYANFFVDNVNALCQALGWNGFTLTRVILPIGISFVVFQKITYCLDIARGTAQPAKNFFTYIEYLFIFPQIIAGPIVTYRTVAEQIRNLELRRFDPGNTLEGFYRFSTGIFKKTWIADVLAQYADIAFNGSAAGIPIHYCWFGAICYTLQIYFDFSAYSDMAIGLLKIMGFTIPENFNHPYISKSINEFWKRWHISLTSWMRDYLYIPLGGNRKGKFRTYFNRWIVFVLSGFWHGADWTFVLWGVFHGTLLCGEKLFLLKRTEKLPAFVQVCATLFFVIIGWVLFRASDVTAAFVFLGRMFDFGSISVHPDRFMYVDNRGMFIFILACVLVLLPLFEPLTAGFRQFAPPPRRGRGKTLCCAGLFLLSALKIGTAAISPFIYFRF